MEATQGQDDTQLGTTDSQAEMRVMFTYCMIIGTKLDKDGVPAIQAAHGWCMSPNSEAWEAECFSNAVLKHAGEGWKPFGQPNALAVSSMDIVKALTAYDMADSSTTERDLQEGPPA